MKWFYNLKISIKLIIGFIIVAAIAGLIGYQGIANLRKIEAADAKLYENYTMPISYMSDISAIFQRVRVNVRDIIRAQDTDEIENIIRANQEIRNQATLISDLYEKSVISTDLKKELEKFKGARVEFGKDIDEVYALARANKDSQAYEVLSGKMKRDAEIEMEVIERMDEMTVAEAKGISESNTEMANGAIRFMLILLAIGVILAIGLGILISRIISRPIAKMQNAAQKLALGNVNVEVDIDAEDEVGMLARAFTKMIDNIKSQAEIANKIAAGDLKVAEKISSEDDVLGKSLAKVIETLRSLILEVTELSKAAVEGKLSSRGNTSLFEGGYKDIVKGINETLDAVIQPVNESSLVLQEVAKGNLQISVNGNYKGDHAELKNALNSTIDTLKSYVEEISRVLTEMSNGNLDLEITNEYKGDFIDIKQAINLIIRSFNTVLAEFNTSSDQVASGANHVSDSSQALSQGSAEQASSIEQITASMSEISVQTKQNAENANQANELSITAKENAIQGNAQMKDMLKAMEEINESSANISKIIKVIDDIAFQTNILALNAAVEAARAGQHGKGFAVVAEEVRNLAARSANAAKETTDMIEGSIKKVETGTNIAHHTADALNKIVEDVTKAANIVGDIAVASTEQATGIAQVNQGINQVSQVTQTNTATAQQSASASEELSSQAQILKEMIRKFKLKKSEQDSNSFRSMEKSSKPQYESEPSNYKKSGRKDTSAKNIKISLDDNEFGKY